MISFISGPHLKEEPCCKFMLKHDIKSYIDNLRKLESFTSSEIQHIQKDLAIFNYVWLEQLGACVIYGILSDKIFVLLEKFANYIKLFKIQGTGCYNMNFTFVSSQRGGFLKFVFFITHDNYDYSL